MNANCYQVRWENLSTSVSVSPGLIQANKGHGISISTKVVQIDRLSRLNIFFKSCSYLCQILPLVVGGLIAPWSDLCKASFTVGVWWLHQRSQGPAVLLSGVSTGFPTLLVQESWKDLKKMS